MVKHLEQNIKDDLMASMLGLQVHGIGRKFRPSGELAISKPRTLNAYALVYLDGGSGMFLSAETEKKELRTGTAFFLFPGIWHQYGPREKDSWKEYWFIFEGFIPDQFRRNKLISPAEPFFHMGYDKPLIRQWKACLSILETAQPGYPRLLGERLFAVLGHILTNAQPDKKTFDPHAGLIEDILLLMEEHIADPDFSLKEYGNHFHLSYSALRKIFKTRVGYSPSHYFARMKMQVAKSRLLSTNDTVKAIAMDLGYEDPYHFSRRFKQLTGLAPDIYRQAFLPQPPST